RTWSRTTRLPSEVRGSGATAYNGYVYSVVGVWNSGGSATSTVYYAKINPSGSLGNCIRTTAFPSNDDDLRVAVYNGYLYAGASDFTNTLYYAPLNADGSVGAWTASTASLTASSNGDHATKVISNGYLYATVGGSVATTTVQSIQVDEKGKTAAEGWKNMTALQSGLEFHTA